MTKTRLFIALLFPLTMAACGGGASIKIDDLDGKVLDAICTQDVACGQFADKASCLAALQVSEAQIVADVKAGKIKYDGSAAADCLDAISGQSCNLTDQLGAGTPQSCLDALKGAVADAGACFTDEECVSANCDTSMCTGGMMCCAGTCAAAPTKIAIGGDCSASGSRCVDDAFCKQNGSAATCTAKVANGQPCTGFSDCVAGSICNLDFTTGMGTCGSLPARGETCMADGFGCNSSEDYCDSTTMKCTAKVAPGGACPAGNECVDYAKCNAMVCAAKAGAGGTCMVTSDCLGDLECQSGTCGLPTAPPACM